MTAAGCPVVIIIPGNGAGGDIRRHNFYGWAEHALQGRGFEVRLPEGGMPDPLKARETIWCPCIIDTMGAGPGSVLVGHSSGAVAGLRVAETTQLAGLVLVAGYDNDLDDKLERESGYFSRPFDWERIRGNCGFIVQFAGSKDRLVPVAVQRRVAQALRLQSEEETDFLYVEEADGDHFFSPPFPRLVDEIVKRTVEKC